jgi:hypothetical protein
MTQMFGTKRGKGGTSNPADKRLVGRNAKKGGSSGHRKGVIQAKGKVT